MNQAHRLEASYPYFPLSDRVIYITRGFQAEEVDAGLILPEWLEALEQVAELTLDERYEIRNPHTEKVERYIERGRSRCISSGGQPEWFSYMPRHISATVAKKLPSIRLFDRFEKVLSAVGRNPSLRAWREYVKGNRYLRLEEKVTIEGKSLSVPGRAVTLSKSGGAIVFRPSAIFIYFGDSPYETETPDHVFLAVARKIAGLLKAEVNTKGFL
jgi:hypothetical protein